MHFECTEPKAAEAGLFLVLSNAWGQIEVCADFHKVKDMLCPLLLQNQSYFIKVYEIPIQKPATQDENNLIWLSRSRQFLRLCRENTWQLK